jgi:hypothetical protein
MIKRKTLAVWGTLAGLTACLGDFIVLFTLAPRYPGYNHLTDTWSKLGASASPVSDIASASWVLMGFLFILFAAGVYFAFPPVHTTARIAPWLIALYGIGEGAGSGLFKANHIGNVLAVSGVIHDALGAIGILAILTLPLIMPDLIPEKDFPGFKRFSRIILIIGLVFLALFISRFLPFPDFIVIRFKGLWQRLFIFDCYLYLTVIALWIIRRKPN